MATQEQLVQLPKLYKSKDKMFFTSFGNASTVYTSYKWTIFMPDFEYLTRQKAVCYPIMILNFKVMIEIKWLIKILKSICSLVYNENALQGI